MTEFFNFKIADILRSCRHIILQLCDRKKVDVLDLRVEQFQDES